MSLSRLPEPDASVLARSGAIVKELEQLLGADAVISDEEGRRAFEADALTAYRSIPLAVVLPRTTEEVAKILKYCHQNAIKVVPRGAGTSLCGRRAARRGRHRHRPLAHEPHPRGRHREPHHLRGNRHHQPGDHRGGGGGGLLLCPRPVEPARLHARRQPRHELRRRPLPQVRRHHQQRAGPAHRADRRRDRRHRRALLRRRRLRPPGPDRRLGGPVRHRHRGDAAHPARSPRAPARSFWASIRARRPAAASPASSPRASSRWRSSSWTGRRSPSPRPTPTPATRSTSRRC